MKKVLITGGSGLLGTALQKTNKNNLLYPTWYNGKPTWRQLDICNKLSVYRLFSDFKFDVIIHCAALGNVDFCEKVPSVCDEVNIKGTMNIINCLKELKQNPLFVYISSNAVYDGDNPLYDETSKQEPINKYGMSKRWAEIQITLDYPNWMIVRPFMLFGNFLTSGRNNWYDIITLALMSGQQLKLVDDIIWQPSNVKWVAQTIWNLIDKEQSQESYNISQGESMSLYEFGLKIAKSLNLDESLLSPISNKLFPVIAKRPINTSYDISKIKELVEVPTVESELIRMANV